MIEFGVNNINKYFVKNDAENFCRQTFVHTLPTFHDFIKDI